MSRVALFAALLMLLLGGKQATAQDPGAVALAVQKPRFVAAWAPAGKVVDASNAAVLQRRVSLDITDVPLNVALRELAQQARLDLTYGRAHLPVGRTVSLHVRDITVVAALTEVLLNSGLDVIVAREGQLALVPSGSSSTAQETQDRGAIVGHVTDAKTQTALAGATVLVQGTSHSATTGSDGRYRIADVAPGTYTVRARYIGYAPGVASVTVSAGQEATADLALEKSAQQLNEVVTTGTVVPTEVKALPTPVSLITAADVELQHAQRTDQLFRQFVPSAVAPEIVTDPEATAMSVRGASSFNYGGGTMKIYLDGVELSDRSFAAIDPNSIERIEVIRGPQAATIYGSDAIGGVMQVFTKRGESGLARPQVDAQAAMGAIQSPYGPFGGGTAFHQQYTASLRGGSTTMSYNLGGGYTHLGDWLPHTAQSLPSVYGGTHFGQGPLSLDLSARYNVQHQETELDPRLAQTGLPDVSKPQFNPEVNQEQTYGLRIGYAATSWWQHNLTVGFDHFLLDIAQSQPRLTTPDDTLLHVVNFNHSKASIAYNTSVILPVGHDVSAIVTAGVDHYVFRSDEYLAFGTLNTNGTITSDPSQSFKLIIRDLTTNTGYFAQAQVGIRDALFLTGGLRAEQNSNFGDALGTPLSPRAGLSFVQQFGMASLKVRGSYGQAIHPPAIGQKDGSPGTRVVRVPNLILAPERQRGWDAGADLVFGARGSLSATYYDQVARDLIQFVYLDAAALPRLAQYQNVGRVKNTGFEFEGTLNWGPAQLRAQYAITRSRPEDLGPGYTGDLRVGEQVIFMPEHTAGASLALAPMRGTSLTAGLTYVGSFTNYDFFAEDRCFASTGPCSPTTRGYLITYPAYAKLSLSINQQIRRGLSGFVSIHNLTNNEAFEFDNETAVMGRVTMVGLHVQY